MTPTDAPRKRWRRLKRFVLVAGLLVVTGIVGLPWLASTPPVRLWLVGTLNGKLAPARVELAGQSFSWLGEQELRGLVLRDQAGKVLVSAARVQVARSMLGLAFERRQGTTVRLHGATLAVERRGDGTIDLIDALQPLVNGGSAGDGTAVVQAGPAETGGTRPALDIEVVRGALEFRSPELADPIVARRLDMSAQIPPAGPMTWHVSLAEPADGDAAALEASGELVQRPGPAGLNLTASLNANHWPLALSTGGVKARGRLDGKLALQCKGDSWSVTGTAQVLDLDASGPALAGDRLRLDRTTISYDASLTGGSWDVRTLDVASPLGSLKALGQGSIASATHVTSRVEGHLDLAALARQLPHAMRIREGLRVEKGSATLQIDVSNDAPARLSRFGLEAGLSDVVARDGTREIVLRNPARLSAKLVRKSGNLHVDQLDLKTAFLNATGKGDIEGGVSVTATVDLAGLKTQLQDVVDFGGLDFAGQGRIGADYRRGAGGSYVARFAAELKTPRVAGLTAAPIVRTALRLDAAASGPVGESGLPRAWSQAKLTVATDDVTAAARLSTAAPAELVLIDDVHLELVMSRPAGQPAEAVRFAAGGRYEPSRGVLELRPLSGNSTPEPIALGAEGVTVQGLKQGGELHVASVLDGDLAGLDRLLAWWSGSEVMGMTGKLTAKTGVAVHRGGELTIAATFDSPDLSMPGAPGMPRRPYGPVIIAAGGASPAGSNRIDFKNVAMACRYASVHATGSLADPGGRRVADFVGKLVPNWATLDPLFAQTLEPHARLRGEFRQFHVQGPLTPGGTAPILASFNAELGIDRFEAQAFGLQLAPTPVVLHWRGKHGLIEPIQTTVNGGPGVIKSDVIIDDTGTTLLRIAGGSTLQNVQINDNVSQSLLSYAAPVLRDATHVRGRVSMNVERGEFPLMGDPARRCTLVGKVEFNDVEFTAGKFANDLVGLTGKRNPSVKLEQPVELTIANGRVTQHGLAVALGRDARLELDGSVGFDQTLAMQARLPLGRGALGAGADAADLAEALRVGVPIGGTLSRPTIDRRALRVGLGDAGRAVLERRASDLLKGLTRPRDGASNDGIQNR